MKPDWFNPKIFSVLFEYRLLLLYESCQLSHFTSSDMSYLCLLWDLFEYEPNQKLLKFPSKTIQELLYELIFLLIMSGKLRRVEWVITTHYSQKITFITSE